MHDFRIPDIFTLCDMARVPRSDSDPSSTFRDTSWYTVCITHEEPHVPHRRPTLVNVVHLWPLLLPQQCRRCRLLLLPARGGWGREEIGSTLVVPRQCFL